VLALDLPEGSSGLDLRETLARLHPGHAGLVRSCRLAVGVEFVEDDAPLAEGAEVVLIPR